MTIKRGPNIQSAGDNGRRILTIPLLMGYLL